jgi:hypothetical protein
MKLCIHHGDTEEVRKFEPRMNANEHEDGTWKDGKLGVESKHFLS